MADKSDLEIQHLVKAINTIDFGNNIIQYFSKARTNRYPVNPYWPRGSCITAASFFINEDNKWQNFDDYLAFEKSANTSREFENPDFTRWIAQLPDFIKGIKNFKEYQGIWSAYQQLLTVSLPVYSSILAETERRINAFNQGSPNDAQVVFAPNLLQSPFAADNVSKNDTVFVVTTRPEISILIHEYLHPIFRQHRDLLIILIGTTDFNLMADTGKMAANGYLWDESIEAKLRVLEESLVRGISLALATGNADESPIMASWQADQGFILVPAIIQQAKIQPPTQNNLAEFLHNSIALHINKLK
ncbi:MAG: hypothetical protein PHE50_06385 [Dehalococcoidales bacterium]|nr:hypothetical protein [Dehalococcoidales bacterium]